ncbi:single-stranded DNA-binding protein [Shewanella glacialipiscicola]|uniref:single-stranded DNA-binding protein n=1 Tax=Shewanella glacialipiscicola TaxID=614069 RepID=UPI003D7A6ECC
MSSVNKVILIGNIGQDIEFKTLANGSSVANFTLATSDNFKDSNGVKQEVTDWHRIVVWGKLAEILNAYASKGRKIYVEGKQKTRKWTDSNNQERQTTEVVVDFDGQVQLLDRAPQNNNTNGHVAPQQGYAAPQQGYVAPQQGNVAPQQGYAAPQQGHVAPQQGYAAPQQGQKYTYRK